MAVRCERARSLSEASVPADRVKSLRDGKQVVMFSVEWSRVPTWHQAVLQLIGDAAHVVSPVGGAGISHAFQAVIAANVHATENCSSDAQDPSEEPPILLAES